MKQDTKRMKIVKVANRKTFEYLLLVGTQKNILKWILKNQQSYQFLSLCKWFNKYDHEQHKRALIGIDEDGKHKTMVYPLNDNYDYALQRMSTMQEISDSIYFDEVDIKYV